MASTSLSDHPLLTLHDQPAMQNADDTLNAILNAPVKKLDADEYVANDLDGAQDSVLGSGNMNFLMMQAGQTNEAMRSGGLYEPFANGDIGSSPQAAPDTARPFVPAQNGDSVAMDRDPGASSDPVPAHIVQSGTAIAANTLGATSYSSSSQTTHAYYGSSGSIDAVKGVSGKDGRNGTDGDGAQAAAGEKGASGTDGTNGKDGSDGRDGHDGRDGADGNNGHGCTPDPCGHGHGGDHHGGHGSIINITNNHVHILNDNDVFNDNRLIGDITIGDIVNGGDIVETVSNTVTTVTNNFFETIQNVSSGNGILLGPLGLNLDVAADTLSSLTLDVFNGGNTATILHETLDLSPVTSTLSPVISGLSAAVSASALLNPFSYDASASDTDLRIDVPLALPGTPIHGVSLDIPLDVAEIILGDIDAHARAGHVLPSLLQGNGTGDNDLSLSGVDAPVLAPVLDLAGPLLDNALNPVEDIVGDVDIAPSIGLDLLGSAGPEGADTDISVPVDIDLLGANIVSDSLALSLDPVEAITGDIDVSVPVATQVLGASADPLVDSGAGGSGSDTILSQFGDVLSGTGHALLPLPDNDAPQTTIGTGAIVPGIASADNVADLFLSPAPLTAPVTDVADCAADSVVGSDLVQNLFSGLDTALGLLETAPSCNFLPIAGITDGVAGAGESLSSWTESIVPDPAGMLGSGLIDHALAGLDVSVSGSVSAGGALPLPTPAGVLDLAHTGGNTHGGLFG